MQNKNILLATGIYPPDIGGPATYVKLLQKELPKYGFKVKVITYGDGEQEKGVYKISRKQNVFLRYFKYFLAMWRLRKWADIVFAFDQISSGFPVVVFKKFFPDKKFVIRIGGDFLWEKAYNNSWTNKPLSKYYQESKNLTEKIYIAIYNFVFSAFDKVVFSTDWQKNILLDHFTVLQNKSFVVNNPFPDINLESLNLQKRNNFLFVGRFVKIKNLKILIDVFCEFKNLNLDIVGDGPLNDFLKDNKCNNIFFSNSLSHQDLLGKIKNSYALIIPSITEISSNVVLEALKFNVPVLLTKESGYLDMFPELLFFNPFDKKDLKNKISFLLKKENYKIYQNKIKQINKSRTWNDFISDLFKILK